MPSHARALASHHHQHPSSTPSPAHHARNTCSIRTTAIKSSTPPVLRFCQQANLLAHTRCGMCVQASTNEPSSSPYSTVHEHQLVSERECSSSSPRRALLLGAVASGLSAAANPVLPVAQAMTFAPPGYRTQDDKLDGYSFFYPEGWLPITSSGNDCFLRNPRNIEENCFVDITSPSSSTYQSISDLGTPEQTATKALDRYLNKEFMSTRIGIRREGQVLYAESREGRDGRTYYDIGIRMSSYASGNPYVATQGEVLQDYGLEWDRVLLTTLGVANKRLYELRLQTAQTTYEASKPKLDQMRTSFALRDVDTAGS